MQNKNKLITNIIPATTYSRMLLSEWLPLKNLIWLHGSNINQRKEQQPNQLNDDIIAAALESPYFDFFVHAFNALARIEKLRLTLLQQKDESLQEARREKLDVDDSDPIPESVLEKVSLTGLENLQQQLFNRIELQHDQWQQNHERWAEDLLAILIEENIELSEDEQAEFYDEERFCDLFSRAREVSMPFKQRKGSSPSFATYFELKTRLLLHNALSYRQLPHTADDISDKVKPCNNYFSQVGHDEKQLRQLQAEEIASEMGILMQGF